MDSNDTDHDYSRIRCPQYRLFGNSTTSYWNPLICRTAVPHHPRNTPFHKGRKENLAHVATSTNASIRLIEIGGRIAQYQAEKFQDFSHLAPILFSISPVVIEQQATPAILRLEEFRLGLKKPNYALSCRLFPASLVSLPAAPQEKCYYVSSEAVGKADREEVNKFAAYTVVLKPVGYSSLQAAVALSAHVLQGRRSTTL